ncbi:hypothetical protein ABT063_46755, partial [Streptomyces sp. NPDC002838]
MDEEALTIRLTHDQAFVLSDWLYQVMFQSDDLEGIVHDRAVWSPIYAISGTLDKTLSEMSNAHDLWIGLGLDAKGVPSRVIDFWSSSRPT